MTEASVSSARLQYKCGDVLVVQCRKALSVQGVENLKASITEVCREAGWPDKPAILVIDNDMSIGIVGQAFGTTKDTVETAVFKIKVEGAEEVGALNDALKGLADAEERISASSEKAARATKARADSMDRLLGRLDAEQRFQATLARINAEGRISDDEIESLADEIDERLSALNEALAAAAIAGLQVEASANLIDHFRAGSKVVSEPSGRPVAIDVKCMKPL